MVVLAGAAVLSHVVVATTLEKVTAKTCVAIGCVVGRRVVFITFAIDEMLADS